MFGGSSQRALLLRVASRFEHHHGARPEHVIVPLAIPRHLALVSPTRYKIGLCFFLPGYAPGGRADYWPCSIVCAVALPPCVSCLASDCCHRSRLTFGVALLLSSCCAVHLFAPLFFSRYRRGLRYPGNELAPTR